MAITKKAIEINNEKQRLRALIYGEKLAAKEICKNIPEFVRSGDQLIAVAWAETAERATKASDFGPPQASVKDLQLELSNREFINRLLCGSAPIVDRKPTPDEFALVG